MGPVERGVRRQRGTIFHALPMPKEALHLGQSCVSSGMTVEQFGHVPIGPVGSIEAGETVAVEGAGVWAFWGAGGVLGEDCWVSDRVFCSICTWQSAVCAWSCSIKALCEPM